MKILVFGATSSVGKELVPILNNSMTIAHDFNGNAFYRSENLITPTSKECDLTKRNEVDAILDWYKPDCVINLAAKCGGIYDNINNPYAYLVDNLQINLNVIESCRKNNIHNLLCVSSTCVYPDVLDDSHYPLKEECIDLGSPPQTNYAYAISKRAMQTQIEFSNKQFGTNFTYIIPSNLYGYYSHYDDSAHFLGKLIHKICDFNEGKIDKIEMMGSSKGKRQFTFVSDIANLIWHWIYYEQPQFNCNVANPENLTIREITDIALRVCKCKAKVTFSDESMVGQLNKEVSCERLFSIIPHQIFCPLELGIEAVYNRISQ